MAAADWRVICSGGNAALSSNCERRLNCARISIWSNGAIFRPNLLSIDFMSRVYSHFAAQRIVWCVLPQRWQRWLSWEESLCWFIWLVFESMNAQTLLTRNSPLAARMNFEEWTHSTLSSVLPCLTFRYMSLPLGRASIHLLPSGIAASLAYRRCLMTTLNLRNRRLFQFNYSSIGWQHRTVRPWTVDNLQTILAPQWAGPALPRTAAASKAHEWTPQLNEIELNSRKPNQWLLVCHPGRVYGSRACAAARRTVASTPLPLLTGEWTWTLSCISSHVTLRGCSRTKCRIVMYSK